MGDLLKTSTVTPADPGVGASPGTPGHPAYCIDKLVTTTTDYDSIIVYIYDSLGNVVGWFITAGGSTTSTHTEHVCFPASPGTPATPGVGGHPGKTDLHPGWNASGTGIVILGEHNGRYQFSLTGSSVGVVTGFNTVNEGDGYAEINYAIYAQSGLFRVMESGIAMTALAPFADSDVFMIERRNGEVIFYRNDVPLWTSGVPCFESLFVDASLYLAGDEVLRADLFDDGPSAGPAPHVLGQLIGYASQTGGADVHAILGGLVGVATDDLYPIEGGADGILRGLVGEAYDSSTHCFTSGVLAGLEGTAGGDEFTPPYAIVEGVLRSVEGFSVGFDSAVNSGSVAGVLGPLYDYASDYDYHEVRGILRGVDLHGGLGVSHGTLIDGWIGRYGFLGIAHADTPLGLDATLSGYSMRGYGGGAAVGTLPTPTFTGSGTVVTLGRLQAVAPAYRFTGHGITTIPGQLHAVYRGVYALTGYGGGALRSTGPVGSFVGHGLVGGVGVLRGVAPSYSMLAHGIVGNFGNVIGVLAGLTPGISGVLVATAPRYAFRGVGSEDVSVEYEGYSMTLTPTPEGNEAIWTTHYTNFPFDRIVRFGNKHYGVAADGLYELGGDTFDGAPIVATFRMAMQDHGQPEYKRGVMVHLTGRVSADMEVSVITDEKDTNVYKYRPQLTGAGTARVLIGKGIRAHYWAYEFSNTKGEDFSLDNVTPAPAVTKRAV